ncbi:MAG: DUF4129 domain-containing protein [Coriobacteriaceae bacterium]|nr:DUF4129 domain-containing protein [Coriobacteriaceae bacterium]
MTFASYMKGRIGEFLLVWLATSATAEVALNGFYLDEMLATVGWAGRAAIVALICLILVFVLYAGTWRRSRLVAGIIAYLACCAVLIVVCLLLSTGENPYLDVEGNYFYFSLVVALAPALCFMLTRTLPGSAVWFVFSAFICAIMQALYESGELVASIVAVLAGLALIVHKNFGLGLERADVALASNPRRNFAVAAASCAAVVAAALAIWFAVIAPLNPDVLDIKLVTDYRRLPVEEYKGTSEQQPELNFDYTSQNLVDGFPYTTDEPKEDENSDVEVEVTSELEQQLRNEIVGEQGGNSDATGGGTREVIDQNSLEQQWDAVSYSWQFPWVVVLIILITLVILAILAYFIGRRLLRRRRLDRLLAQDAASGIEGMYLYLLSRLGRLGFKVQPGSTLLEFASRSEARMDAITEETQVSFAALTEVYTSCAYGHYEPTEDDTVAFTAFYLRFWKAARAYLGTIRYFFRSFRL